MRYKTFVALVNAMKRRMCGTQRTHQSSVLSSATTSFSSCSSCAASSSFSSSSSSSSSVVHRSVLPLSTQPAFASHSLVFAQELGKWFDCNHCTSYGALVGTVERTGFDQLFAFAYAAEQLGVTIEQWYQHAEHHKPKWIEPLAVSLILEAVSSLHWPPLFELMKKRIADTTVDVGSLQLRCPFPWCHVPLCSLNEVNHKLRDVKRS